MLYMYESYKKARNLSWEILLTAGITSLPVDLNKVLKTVNIKAILYCDAFFDTDSPGLRGSDGFVTKIGDKKAIYLNENKGTIQRRRFTLAHELGHIVLDHPINPIIYRNSEIDEGQKPEEVQANIFARDLLMPAGVLAKLHVTTVDEIMQICNVSYTSARIRLERLTELYKRNKFGVHPLERQGISQFKDFISSKNNRSLLP